MSAKKVKKTKVFTLASTVAGSIQSAAIAIANTIGKSKRRAIKVMAVTLAPIVENALNVKRTEFGAVTAEQFGPVRKALIELVMCVIDWDKVFEGQAHTLKASTLRNYLTQAVTELGLPKDKRGSHKSSRGARGNASKDKDKPEETEPTDVKETIAKAIESGHIEVAIQHVCSVLSHLDTACGEHTLDVLIPGVKAAIEARHPELVIIANNAKTNKKIA